MIEKMAADLLAKYIRVGTIYRLVHPDTGHEVKTTNMKIGIELCEAHGYTITPKEENDPLARRECLIISLPKSEQLPEGRVCVLPLDKVLETGLVDTLDEALAYGQAAK